MAFEWLSVIKYQINCKSSYLRHHTSYVICYVTWNLIFNKLMVKSFYCYKNYQFRSSLLREKLFAFFTCTAIRSYVHSPMVQRTIFFRIDNPILQTFYDMVRMQRIARKSVHIMLKLSQIHCDLFRQLFQIKTLCHLLNNSFIF